MQVCRGGNKNQQNVLYFCITVKLVLLHTH
nr:MAG TPA: hypothetical protein [Caudoviricetes sp.]